MKETLRGEEMFESAPSKVWEKVEKLAETEGYEVNRVGDQDDDIVRFTLTKENFAIASETEQEAFLNRLRIESRVITSENSQVVADGHDPYIEIEPRQKFK